MKFSKAIQKFNKIYKLPVEKTPTLEAVGDPVQRLINFRNILEEELGEFNEVMVELEKAKDGTLESKLTALTSLADLLGDIQVYCSSEMAKFGLDQDEILHIIMQSNFSKLGEDGKPIYDERGKVQKGPNYWKPEPKIREFLSSKLTK